MTQPKTLHDALAVVRGGPQAADKPVPATLAEALSQVRSHRPMATPQKPESAKKEWWQR